MIEARLRLKVPRWSRRSQPSGLQSVECHRRCLEVIPKLVDQNASALVFIRGLLEGAFLSRRALNSVTASAIALSRHRLSVRNSLTENGRGAPPRGQ